MSDIKVVIYDVGGVLALGKYSLPKFKRKPIGRSFHEYMAKYLKVDMDTWIDCTQSIIDEANEGTHTRNQALKKMAKNLEVDSKYLEKSFLKAYSKTFVFNKKLINHARALHKKGYMIAILSDQWQVPNDVLIPKNLRKLFDPVVVSCEVKMRKPHPNIYKYILKKLKGKAKAKECVFIDNREYNLVTARKLGMKTVLFEDTKQTIRNLEKIGVKL